MKKHSTLSLILIVACLSINIRLSFASDEQSDRVLRSLRKKAIEDHQPEAMLRLIEMGDNDVIKESVGDLDNRIRRRQTERMLKESTQPKLIVALGGNLNLNESAQVTFVGDVGIEPKSVAAGHMIQAIILNSPAFDTQVKQWASGGVHENSLIDKSEYRKQMRIWWSENRSFFVAGEYNKVKPPSTWSGN